MKKVAFVTQASEELADTMGKIRGFDVMKNFRDRADMKCDQKPEILEQMKDALFGKSDPESADTSDILDRQMLAEYNRLDLAVSQLELSLDYAKHLSCYMTPYGDFSRLPNAIRRDNLFDIIPIDLGDLFAALCSSPTPFSNILHLRSNCQSKLHFIHSQGTTVSK